MKLTRINRQSHQQRSETPTSRVLYVPRAVLNTTHEYFLPYWQVQVEVAAFWAGLEVGDTQVVTTVAVPSQLQTPGNYQVSRDSLRRMTKKLSGQGLTILAQVHTHPGRWVGHSPYDDGHAYSTSNGSLSLVWPHYGDPHFHSLNEVGVHERQDGTWAQLAPSAVSKRVRVVDSFVDTRWQISGGIPDVE